jgi:gonadotropin-releasing hormone receptor
MLDQRITRGLFIFACVNSVMNPIVYGFFNLRKNKSRRCQQVSRP